VPAAHGGVEAAALQALVERGEVEALDRHLRAHLAQLPLQERRELLPDGARRGHDHGEGERHAGARPRAGGAGGPAERVEHGARARRVVRELPQRLPPRREGARHRAHRHGGERVDGVAHEALAVDRHGERAAQLAVGEQAVRPRPTRRPPAG
jgi:hypothetical protein